jgi:hypothetical protein
MWLGIDLGTAQRRVEPVPTYRWGTGNHPARSGKNGVDRRFPLVPEVGNHPGEGRRKVG